MFTTRASVIRVISGSNPTLINGVVTKSLGLHPTTFAIDLCLRPTSKYSHRQFSTTRRAALEYFPPPRDAPSIKVTPPSWPHPGFTFEEMEKVDISHRKPENWQDRIALGVIKFCRWWMDKALSYHNETEVAKALKEGKPGYVATERQWIIRFIFLETIAGVPGMAGGMLRHLRSLRRMKRDNGWIETLLEEAYNERMHLLTFMQMAQPGLFMKTMILGGQFVFFNGFFISYLISPKICHRLVGYLEEEAVKTYTHVINDIESGLLPSWNTVQAPDLAIRYWQMPEGHQTMKDLIYYVRADEAKHREVNHTLSNLDPKIDPNPYASEYKDPSKPHPSKGLEIVKPIGWERSEVI